MTPYFHLNVASWAVVTNQEGQAMSANLKDPALSVGSPAETARAVGLNKGKRLIPQYSGYFCEAHQ